MGAAVELFLYAEMIAVVFAVAWTNLKLEVRFLWIKR